MKILWSFLLVMFCSMPFIIAQSGSDQNLKSRSWSLQVIKGYEIYGREFDGRHASSNFGIEGQVTFHRSKKWGIQLKSSWMKWPDSRETYFPVLIGPELVFPMRANLDLAIYANGGPTVLIGNDFGSVFGCAESGIQIGVGDKKGLLIGLAWSQNLTFHPGHFSYIKGAVGWRF